MADGFVILCIDRPANGYFYAGTADKQALYAPMTSAAVFPSEAVAEKRAEHLDRALSSHPNSWSVNHRVERRQR